MAELTEFRKPSTKHLNVYAIGERDPAFIGGYFY